MLALDKGIFRYTVPINSDQCLYSHEEGKQNSTCCFAQHYGVTYPPQEKAKGCLSTSCEQGALTSFETGNVRIPGDA